MIRANAASSRVSNGIERLRHEFNAFKGNGRRAGVKAKGKLNDRDHPERTMWVTFWGRGEDIAYDVSDEEKNEIFQQALVYFGKSEEYSALLKQLEIQRMTKEKFNGNRVKEWTGTDGKALGSLMKKLRGNPRLSFEQIVMR